MTPADTPSILDGDMKNFGIGLALGFVGLLILVVVWVLNSFGEPMAGYQMPGYNFFIRTGQVIGIGGVLTYWIILPIIHRVRR